MLFRSIGSAAWYEMLWVKKQNPTLLSKICIRRYMDDIFCTVKDCDTTNDLLGSFKANYEEGGCYPTPLSLTNDDNTHYLECEVIQGEGDIPILFKHWNKNKGLHKQIFYKGKNWHSTDNIKTKRGAIVGTYIRIDRNTSTKELYNQAVLEKKQELLTLGYPINFINNIQNARKFTPKI